MPCWSAILAQRRQECVRWDDVPALAEDRLDDERRDVVWIGHRREQPLDLAHRHFERSLAGAVASATDSERIRERHVVHAAQKRFVVAAVLDARAGQRHGGVRPAVEAAVEGDDQRPSRGDLGELDRGFDRLGARVRQEHADLLVELAREVARQPLVELQAGLVIDDVLLAVDQLRRLVRDRGSHPGMCVARVDDADTRRVVEVPIAVDSVSHEPSPRSMIRSV